MDAFLSLLATVVCFGILGVAAFGFIAWLVENTWHGAPKLKAATAKWLDAHAAPEWRVVHRLHSVQIAVFWAVVGGLWAALPAFQTYLPPIRFAVLCVGFSLAMLFARFTKQAGLPE